MRETERYEAPGMEIILMSRADVITLSNGTGGGPEIDPNRVNAIGLDTWGD